MPIKLKSYISGLLIDVCVINSFNSEEEMTQMEKELLEFEIKNKDKFDKLITFIKRISNNGLEPYKMNTEKLEFMTSYRNTSILAIKTFGVRMLSIAITNDRVVLLELFKKKQKKYNKLNKESLERAKKQIDLLYSGGIL